MPAPVSTKGIDLTSPDGFTELETAVRCRLCGYVREFRLEIRAEGLVLRGYARTYYAKQVAQHAVMAVTDVPILTNDIMVS